MSRQRIFWFAITILILSSLACNAFAGDLEPGLEPRRAVERALGADGSHKDRVDCG